MPNETLGNPKAGHVFLPPLEQISFQVPREVGVWDGTNDKSALNTLANDIPVAAEGPINSIPDIWARPVMFNLFLPKGQDADPLVARVRQEWRGLLSILALRELSDFTVELDEVDLGKVTVDKLKQPLLKLKPKAVEWGGVSHDWAHLVLVRVRKDDEVVCLGAFSPTTLVFTGSDYWSRMKSREKITAALDPFLSTDRQGRKVLTPPGPDDKRSRPLRVWISKLAEGLGSLDRKNGFHTAILLKELEDWLDALGGRAAAQGEYEYVPPLKSEAQLTDGRPFYALLSHRVQAVRTEARGLFSLRAGRPLPEGTRDVLIVTPDLFRKGKAVAESEWGLLSPLSVRGGNPEAELEKLFPGESGTDFGGIKLERASWIRPERYFFSEKLLRVRGPAWLSDESFNGHRNVVLPLRQGLLDYFSPEQVWKELKPRIEEREGKTRITIELPVGTGSDSVPVTREYAPSEVVEIAPFGIELFPRYLGPDWLRYYLVTGETEAISCRPCTSRAGGEVSIDRYDRVGRNGRPGATILALAAAPESDGSSAFPEALCLVSKPDGRERGLLLLGRDEKKIEDRPERWTIGIDFGTSNTNIWVERWDNATSTRVGSAQPLSINLGNCFRSIAASPEGVDRTDWLKDCFVPPVEVTMPIASAVRVTDPKRSEVLATSFAHFMTDLDVPANVTAPIKFGNRELQAAYFDSLLVLIFLAGRPTTGGPILRQAELRFTYPKVFSRDEKQQFVATWKERIDHVHRIFIRSWEDITLGHQNQDSDSARDFESHGRESYLPEFLISEGAAAARFFTTSHAIADADRATTLQGLASVDVGGGTTDFTLYTRRGVAYDTSVLLAGQAISRYLRKRPSLWEKLFEPAIADKLKEAHRNSHEGQFDLFLNFGLTRDAASILKRLGSHATDGDLAWLKRMILLQFSSVAYFAGIVAGRDATVVALSRKGTNPKFCWGGRASQFLAWLDGGRFDPKGVTAKVLEALYLNSFARASRTKDDEKEGVKRKFAAFVLSPMPKAEAAAGVVASDQAHRASSESSGALATTGGAGAQDQVELSDELMSLGDEGDGPDDSGSVGNRVLAGDEIELLDRDELVPATEEVSEARLFCGPGGVVNVCGLPLSELSHFVRLCNHAFQRTEFIKDATEEFVPLKKNDQPTEHARTVVTNVMAGLEKEALKPAGRRTLEPIFFAEVKAYINQLLGPGR
ncbi:MAG TPA: hypothetical protein PLL76_09095 [Thermoanaerobaculia bacterium]|jgi:hypothetical protein|nr:hypothetical protein [Thermoanaerobaculia bacterium]HQP86400.1 hypothetical protein [Thermoanaerobaculia bacterium]